MKKLLLLCLACVAALVVLLCVPMKDVQAGDGLSVVLGDGRAGSLSGRFSKPLYQGRAGD